MMMLTILNRNYRAIKVLVEVQIQEVLAEEDLEDVVDALVGGIGALAEQEEGCHNLVHSLLV